MSAMSLLLALGYLAAKIIFWNWLEAGIAPILISLFFFSSVQLFFIGILGEYLGAIYTQVQKRPLVIEKERITTTVTRAKAAKPLVENMITLGKRDTLQSRRQAASYLMTPGATKKLFADIAPRFSDRAGGYTRIIHAGFRIGDGAQLAILELLGSKLKKKLKKEKSAVPETAEEIKEEVQGKALK